MNNPLLISYQVCLEFQSVSVVDAVGRSGVLELFWKDSLDVNILFFSSGDIDVAIKLKANSFFSYFTGFYGHPCAQQKAFILEIT